MKEAEMDHIADLIARALRRVGDERGLAAIGDEVRALCQQFPVYAHRVAPTA